jgi:signal transduction histidine kinase
VTRTARDGVPWPARDQGTLPVPGTEPGSARPAPAGACPRGAAGGTGRRGTGRLPGWVTARAAAWQARYAALSPRGQAVVQDTGLALALAVLNLLSLLPYQSQMHPAWLAMFLVTAQCLPLALRRLWPVPALILCGIPRNLFDTLQFGYAPLPLAPAIAFATVADRSRPWLRWTTLAVSIVGIGASQTLPGHSQPYDAIVQFFIFGAAWTVGTLNRYRRVALSAAAERAARAEASLDAAAARAAAAERVRIARELHDVVAHHVSLMAVQAEAVGALLPARPEAAAQSADLIGSTARAAMTELRRLLGVLRFKDSEDPERVRLTPSPSLSRLDELIAAFREAGLRVTCETAGEQTALTAGIDLTAYRIVQEALTNALRHAPGATVSVVLGYAPAELTVEVTNSRAGAAVAAAAGAASRPGRDISAAGSWSPAGPGYGLAGIAERVASCGGSLALGPAEGGGFTVTARLPIGHV